MKFTGAYVDVFFRDLARWEELGIKFYIVAQFGSRGLLWDSRELHVAMVGPSKAFDLYQEALENLKAARVPVDFTYTVSAKNYELVAPTFERIFKEPLKRPTMWRKVRSTKVRTNRYSFNKFSDWLRDQGFTD